MNIKPILLSILFSLASLATLFAQRTITDLSTRWKFIRQEVSSNASTQDWQPISVPHTWNNFYAQQGKIGYPGEKYGYYRGPSTSTAVSVSPSTSPASSPPPTSSRSWKSW